ncbi:TRAP transporter small permease [Saccharococcus caldoxylosilyticus]|uniref:TRAP transporter small permease n=1 Tax=Saccharococcus caldoxylosilyticus TaxID=81408 RepID=UPI0003638C5E|nr:TRAP transporter small permease [Parageobacillus caldoxylosilyticus]
MKKNRKLYSLFEDMFAGLFLLSGLSLILFEVIMRYVFNSPTTWTTEVSTVMVAWGILIGLSVALRDKHHICVDILYVIFPHYIRRTIDYFANLVGIIFCMFYIWSGFTIILQTIETGQLSMETGIPLWIYYLVIPVSGVLFMIRFIDQFNEVRKSKNKKDEMIHLNPRKENADEYSNAL